MSNHGESQGWNNGHLMWMKQTDSSKQSTPAYITRARPIPTKPTYIDHHVRPTNPSTDFPHRSDQIRSANSLIGNDSRTTDLQRRDTLSPGAIIRRADAYGNDNNRRERRLAARCARCHARNPQPIHARDGEIHDRSRVSGAEPVGRRRRDGHQRAHPEDPPSGQARRMCRGDRPTLGNLHRLSWRDVLGKMWRRTVQEVVDRRRRLSIVAMMIKTVTSSIVRISVEE
ncbi:hypothetical protein NHQ30_007075 [Ciborinia camelliae]|nr:hypothetical protein NHQ30_007075 [Ciborinia camelliae]